MDHVAKAPIPAIMEPEDIGLTAIAEIEQLKQGLPHGQQWWQRRSSSASGGCHAGFWKQRRPPNVRVVGPPE
eukprot:12932718-Prorocentrum_lima.AAC.1